MAEPREHVPEIDWLKGFAILCVVCIHAKFGEGTAFFEYVVNRAVPIFLVLFGVTSELSRGARDAASVADRAERAREWYGPRLRRLVPPVWALATAWWIAVLHLDRAEELRVGWPQAVATYLGFAPWIGTSWFITVILQLVLVYPALEWLVDRMGLRACLVFGAAVCVVSLWFVWDIVAAGVAIFGNNVPPPGWFYYWIFAPRVFVDVFAGIAVARWYGGRPGARVTAGALLLAAAGTAAAEWARASLDLVTGVVLHQAVTYLRDVPLTVGLLGLFRLLSVLVARVRVTRILTAFLRWCGLYSWGLYLGHLLVHEVLHMNGVALETGPMAFRGLYAVLLFVSGAVLTGFAGLVERAARHALRPRAVPAAQKQA